MAEKTRVTANLDKLEAIVKKLGDDYLARVGILGNNAGRMHDEESGMTNSEIGLIHEFGSESNNIPPRSFLRMPVETKQDDLVRVLDSGAVKAAVEKGDIKTAYKILGIAAEGIVKDAFRTSGYGSWPANSAATVKRKGSSKPLIDTAALMSSITSDVVSKRGL